MGNCLKTKLKEIVNNDNLEELGVIRIPVISTNGSRKSITKLGGNSTVTPTLPITVSITDGSLYSNNELQTNPVDWVSPIQREYIANSDGYLKIKNYYNLLGFVMDKYSASGGLHSVGIKEDFVLDISVFKYCSTLHSFGGWFDFKGDIVDAFGHLKGMNDLRLFIGELTGDIKNLVGKFVSNSGNSSGSINTFVLSSNISKVYSTSDMKVRFNGKRIVMTATGKLSWESADKIYITYSDKVITCGYSQSEVDTNTASGGIWESKTVTRTEDM